MNDSRSLLIHVFFFFFWWRTFFQTGTKLPAAAASVVDALTESVQKRQSNWRPRNGFENRQRRIFWTLIKRIFSSLPFSSEFSVFSSLAVGFCWLKTVKKIKNVVQWSTCFDVWCKVLKCASRDVVQYIPSLPVLFLGRLVWLLNTVYSNMES